MIREELADGQHGAFLVWGDPSLYDSTLRILDQVAAMKTVAFDLDVIPGITSVQALAARHRIALNRIGEPIQITTGRQLAKGMTADNVVVMLDGDCAFKNVKTATSKSTGARMSARRRNSRLGQAAGMRAGDREGPERGTSAPRLDHGHISACGRTSGAYSPPRPPAARRSRRTAPARPVRRPSGRRSAVCKAKP